MIPAFSLFTASGILFGRGQAQQAVPWLTKRVQRVLLVRGASRIRGAWLEQSLSDAGVSVHSYSIPAEPTVAMIRQGVQQARQQQIQAVVSLGGGAVLDAGKAIAALIPVPGDITDYLEVVGNGRHLEQPPLTFVAIATTAGTGAEVTKNAVIGVPSHQRKVSLRDERMLADLAIIDPALTDNTPRHTTLFSGLDALTQVIEPYICKCASPLTDALCRDAIPRGLDALLRLTQQECASSRDQMAWVSLCGGLALANAGLGVVHGLAGPLGGLCNVPHGAICGALLPFALQMNQQQVSNNDLSQRIEQLLNWLAQGFTVSPDRACEALRQWSRKAGLPSLQQLGVPFAALQCAAHAAAESSSMKANPVLLTHQQLLTILQQAWHG